VLTTAPIKHRRSCAISPGISAGRDCAIASAADALGKSPRHPRGTLVAVARVGVRIATSAVSIKLLRLGRTAATDCSVESTVGEGGGARKVTAAARPGDDLRSDRRARSPTGLRCRGGSDVDFVVD
jgi:hypothetical protein